MVYKNYSMDIKLRRGVVLIGILISILCAVRYFVIETSSNTPDPLYSSESTVGHRPYYDVRHEIMTATAKSALDSVAVGHKQNQGEKNYITKNNGTGTEIRGVQLTAQSLGVSVGDTLPWKTQQELDIFFQKIKELGVGWVRIDVGWDGIQPDSSKDYNWTNLDRVVTTARLNGINVLGILTYTPKWARNPSCVGGPKCAPSDITQFAEFSKKAAKHFKGTINNWEIWNEPNIPNFWSPKPDVTHYTSLLKVTYVAIKGVNQSAIVITGGLSPATDGYNFSIAPVTFVRALYASGAQDYFDAVALHPYSYPASPDYVANWNAWQQIQQVRSILVAQDDGEKKIWLTEYGVPTGGPGDMHESHQPNFTYGFDYMSENAQATFLSMALLSYDKSKDWLGPFFWYSFKDLGSNSNDPENFFGLLRYDGSKKPAYDVFKNVISATPIKQTSL